MMKRSVIPAIIGAVVAVFASAAGAESLAQLKAFVETAPDDAWRTVDVDNTVYLQLGTMSEDDGWIVIETYPDMAPHHVERIKTLVKEGFYDGILFHRVIDRFMAQAGDPQTKDPSVPKAAWGTKGSDMPTMAPEFMHAASQFPDFHKIGRDSYAMRVGFYHGLPIAAEAPEAAEVRVDKKVQMWPTHCPGVMSMARTSDPNSANSQFFLMFGDARRALDEKYTVWGRIVRGFDLTKQIARGEPPDVPTPIKRMRLGADLDPAQRYQIQVLRTDTPFFDEYVKKTGQLTEKTFPDGSPADPVVNILCNIKIPSRVNGKVVM